MLYHAYHPSLDAKRIINGAFVARFGVQDLPASFQVMLPRYVGLGTFDETL